ncbi:hypothetical protein M9H77_31786 [Catharanthus roseus]|uniref:Uncharacterized protein n=1 Tax=Catharanthus roseus TaxID=4058 RepID=A0ACC0A346_CATRO|nr:hypothetical protein M9H77_31786 [Catharanthus roseus]
MISGLQFYGGRRLLLFLFLRRYSSKSAAAPESQSQNPILVDYLIHSLGFSRREALSATEKVILYKSCRNDPDLVVKFLGELGLTKTQIRSIVSASPSILTCNVEKTLQPRIQVLQDLGMSGSDLIRFLTRYKSIVTRSVSSYIKPPIDYLRNLLGSDENALKAIKKCNCLVDPSTPKAIELNVELLRRKGLSPEEISRLVLDQPLKFKLFPTENLQKVLSALENDFRIPPDSKMFYHGIVVLYPFCKSTIDKKFEVFRSLGWSDATIYRVFRKYPYVISTSEDKLRKVWNFFTKEIGYTPDILATHPSFLNMNFERRVKLRRDVLKILNEKKLNKKKAGLSSILQMGESKFVQDYLLPYKNEIPDVFDSYFKVKKGDRKSLI